MAGTKDEQKKKGKLFHNQSRRICISPQNSLDKLPLEDQRRLAVHALEVTGVLHRWVGRKKQKKRKTLEKRIEMPLPSVRDAALELSFALFA